MHGDVLPGQRGGKLAERRQERGGSEVPHLVVAVAELEEQRLEPGSALQRQLDLDRDPLAAAFEDRIRQMHAGLCVGAQSAGERALADPLAEAELLEQEPYLGDRLDVRGEGGVRPPGAKGRACDAGAGSGQPEKGGAVRGQLPALDPAGLTPAVA